MGRILAGILGLAVLAGLWVALEPQWRSLESAGADRFAELERPQNEVLVGVSWPFALRHDGMADGLELARSEINQAGGIDGRTLRLVLRDDGDDWPTARRIALDFAATPEMVAVIGYFNDGVAIQAATIYERARLLNLLVNINVPAVTAHGYQYVVRMAPTTNHIAALLARSGPHRGERQTYALLWDSGAYGQDFASEYRLAQDAVGGRMVFQWPYARKREDFRLAANLLKSVDADVIAFTGSDLDIIRFLRRADGVGLAAPIVLPDELSEDIRAGAGTAVRRARFLNLYDPADPRPENQHFVASFRQRFGHAPDTAAAQGYDAVRILAAGLGRAHSLNPLDVAYTIRYMPLLRGVIADYSFTPEGSLVEQRLFLPQ
ncbi:ABC transporter substrate-binding protein [Phaeospirillum tilakii]|uniref:ABC transporter substrate-binding protein n=1 Tax=Phaeospirillum tilakii TaxID=741673 RepID=A0ABW5CCJ9_9PROT